MVLLSNILLLGTTHQAGNLNLYKMARYFCAQGNYILVILTFVAASNNMFLMGNQHLHAITPLPQTVGVRISIPISHNIHTPFLNLMDFRYKVPPRGVVFDTSPISDKLLVTWCQCQLGQLSQHSHHQKK